MLQSGGSEAVRTIVHTPDELTLQSKMKEKPVSVAAVCVLTLLMSVMTGLGVVPFFFFGQLDQVSAAMMCTTTREKRFAGFQRQGRLASFRPATLLICSLKFYVQFEFIASKISVSAA